MIPEVVPDPVPTLGRPGPRALDEVFVVCCFPTSRFVGRQGASAGPRPPGLFRTLQGRVIRFAEAHLISFSAIGQTVHRLAATKQARGAWRPATATSLIGFPADDFPSSWRSPSSATAERNGSQQLTKQMAVDDSLLNEMTVEQARGWLARRNRNRDDRGHDRFAITHSINED